MVSDPQAPKFKITDLAPTQTEEEREFRIFPKPVIAVSKTYDYIKRYYCDNCGRYHWGFYEKYKGFDYVEYDFLYVKPNGDPYYCKEGQHILDGGPEYCIGYCNGCRIDAEKWRKDRGLT